MNCLRCIATSILEYLEIRIILSIYRQITSAILVALTPQVQILLILVWPEILTLAQMELCGWESRNSADSSKFLLSEMWTRGRALRSSEHTSTMVDSNH